VREAIPPNTKCFTLILYTEREGEQFVSTVTFLG
jgi:hypothetical protein